MTILNAEIVNGAYGNALNACNPIFQDIISRLISSGLYTSAIAPASIARTSPNGSVQICKNATGIENMSVPLEALVDCISRAVVAGYIKGFTQAGIEMDGASNIGFSLSPSDPRPFTNIGLESAKNVHEAIICLGLEVNAIKAATGTPPLPFPQSPSVIIPDNL